jgi:NADH:ubiquinone oxidoreductase subunit 2 (subunit N)
MSTLLFFTIIMSKRLYNNELIYFNDIRKACKGNSVADYLTIAISLLSMSGIPPAAGFYGKFMIWCNLIEDLYLTNSKWIAILLVTSILLSLVTIFYYMRLYLYLYIDNDSNEYIRAISNMNNDATLYSYGGSSGVRNCLTLSIVTWSLVQPHVYIYIWPVCII